MKMKFLSLGLIALIFESYAGINYIWDYKLQVVDSTQRLSNSNNRRAIETISNNIYRNTEENNTLSRDQHLCRKMPLDSNSISTILDDIRTSNSLSQNFELEIYDEVLSQAVTNVTNIYSDLVSGSRSERRNIINYSQDSFPVTRPRLQTRSRDNIFASVNGMVSVLSVDDSLNTINLLIRMARRFSAEGDTNEDNATNLSDAIDRLSNALNHI